MQGEAVKSVRVSQEGSMVIGGIRKVIDVLAWCSNHLTLLIIVGVMIVVFVSIVPSLL
jgi:hypothetical protein